jgi:hypothetical protein
MECGSGEERSIEEDAASGNAPMLSYVRAEAKGKRRAISPVWLVIAAGIVLLALLLVVAAVLAPFFAGNWDARVVREVPANRPWGGFPPRFQIVAQGIGRGSGMKMQYGYIVYQGEDTPGSMSFDLRTGKCELNTYQGVRSDATALGRGAVLMYVKRAGYAGNDPAAGSTADAIWQEICKLSHQPLGPQMETKQFSGRAGIFEYAPTERRFLEFSVLDIRRSVTYGCPGTRHGFCRFGLWFGSGCRG